MDGTVPTTDETEACDFCGASAVIGRVAHFVRGEPGSDRPLWAICEGCLRRLSRCLAEAVAELDATAPSPARAGDEG